MLKCRIDDEVIELEDIRESGWDGLLTLNRGKRDYYLAEDSESAGKAAREYWEDLAESDPKEFACLVGEKTLIQWGMGHYGGPGSTKVKSLQEWLDLWLTTPEEQWASYDGTEFDVTYHVEDYLEDAKDSLEVDHDDDETHAAPTQAEIEELAGRLLEEAKQEFQDEWGFLPGVAYRHN